MTVTLKIDKGTAERLGVWKQITSDEPKNIIGEDELTLEYDDNEILVELHKKDVNKMLEISDANGSFGIWLHLNKEKIEKLKQIVNELGP